MSWIVERLIMDRYVIETDSNIDSDIFNKTMFLEKKIKEMYKEGLISNIEMSVIENMQQEKSFSQTSRELNLSRTTIAKIFRNACNRIAFYLGGYYTDDGFLDYLKESRNLSDKEIYLVYQKINSRYRHSI